MSLAINIYSFFSLICILGIVALIVMGLGVWLFGLDIEPIGWVITGMIPVVSFIIAMIAGTYADSQDYDEL